MIKVEIEQDAQVPEIRWLKTSYNNGAAWSLIEIRSHEDALQIISALQQSAQPTVLCTCTSNHLGWKRGSEKNCPVHGSHSGCVSVSRWQSNAALPSWCADGLDDAVIGSLP